MDMHRVISVYVHHVSYYTTTILSFHGPAGWHRRHVRAIDVARGGPKSLGGKLIELAFASFGIAVDRIDAFVGRRSSRKQTRFLTWPTSIFHEARTLRDKGFPPKGRDYTTVDLSLVIDLILFLIRENYRDEFRWKVPPSKIKISNEKYMKYYSAINIICAET